MNYFELKKIIKVNGFDTADSNNARQNNYAWSMAEFDGYIYVGTARNTFYVALKTFSLVPPQKYTPDGPVDNSAEIWRRRKDDENAEWELVFKTSPSDQILGFRVMIVYKGALYAGCHTLLDKPYLAVTSNGTDWELIPAGIPDKFGTRSMLVFNDKLYIGATDASNIGEQSTYLYSSSDPKNGFSQVDTSSIKGEISSMISFNGCLYLGTAPAGGFEVHKALSPESGKWKLVVDKGAGDELNEVPLSMEVFQGCLYVGTAIWMAVKSADPRKKFVPFKGFDIIRISPDDSWRVIVGKEPFMPSKPITGVRENGIYESGFGNIFNCYCWQLRSFRNNLFVGSWDSSSPLYNIIKTTVENIGELSENEFLKTAVEALLKYFIPGKENKFNISLWINSLIKTLSCLPENFGFDFLKSSNGFHFNTVSLKGFCNPENCGIRTLLALEDSMLIGTANPAEGLEVWELTEEPCCANCRNRNADS